MSSLRKSINFEELKKFLTDLYKYKHFFNGKIEKRRKFEKNIINSFMLIIKAIREQAKKNTDKAA